MKKLFRKSFSFFIMMIICITGITAIPVPAQDIDSNMLVNPDWRNGITGWQTVEDEPEQMPDGSRGLCSKASQEVSLSGYSARQILHLSGNVSVNLKDPTQQLIRLELEICDGDNKVLVSSVEDEEGTEPVYHEIELAIPKNAKKARVTLSLYKQSSRDLFDFSNLSLKALAAQFPSGHAQEEIDTNPAVKKGDECLFSNMNDDEVLAGPERLMTVDQVNEANVTHITTYHWNDGKGVTPGSISVYEGDKKIGMWSATGRSCSGIPNVFWDAEVDFVMLPGHYYTIKDSGFDTWSYNMASGRCGMFSVYGKTVRTVYGEINYYNIGIDIDKVPIMPVDEDENYWEPLIFGDYIYLQYEAAAMVVGMRASYNKSTRTISLSPVKTPEGTYESGQGHYETVEATVKYRDYKVVFNGKQISLTGEDDEILEPFEYNGTIYLPVGSLASERGYDAVFDSGKGVLNILTKEEEEVPVAPPEKDDPPNPPPKTDTSTDKNKKTDTGDMKKGTKTSDGKTGGDESSGETGGKVINDTEKKEGTGFQTVEISGEESSGGDTEGGKKPEWSMENFMGWWHCYSSDGYSTAINIESDRFTLYSIERGVLMDEIYGQYVFASNLEDLLLYEKEADGEIKEEYYARFRLKDENHLVMFYHYDSVDYPFNEYERPVYIDVEGKWQCYDMNWEGIMFDLHPGGIYMYGQNDIENAVLSRLGKYTLNNVTGDYSFFEDKLYDKSYKGNKKVLFVMWLRLIDENHVEISYRDASGWHTGDYTREVPLDMSGFSGKWQKDTEKGNGEIMEITGNGLKIYTRDEKNPEGEPVITVRNGTFVTEAATGDLLFYEDGRGSMRAVIEDANHLRIYFISDDNPDGIRYTRVTENEGDIDAYMGTWRYVSEDEKGADDNAIYITATYVMELSRENDTVTMHGHIPLATAALSQGGGSVFADVPMDDVTCTGTAILDPKTGDMIFHTQSVVWWGITMPMEGDVTFRLLDDNTLIFKNLGETDFSPTVYTRDEQ